MLVRVVALVLASSVLGNCSVSSRPAAQTQNPPALLVLLVVDQMRVDYLTRFADGWKSGLKRVADEGAVFVEARYPYLNTVTCAGHATIATGAFPATHGIALNEWWDRAHQKRVPCTLDPDVQPLPYGDGKPEPVGHSAHYLEVPTFGDRLRERFPEARVVSLSMKPRSAVMMAGHGGTATWFSDTNSWATSTAFTNAPVPTIGEFIQGHAVESLRATTWERSDDGARYGEEDASDVEQPRRGWTSTFPHPLSGAAGTPDVNFYDLWERSPYSDQYLGTMAAALVDRFELGRRHVTDLLAVSFSGLDYVGHDFGPDSQEVHDTLLRLDRTIGDLLTALDARVGRDRYVVALSADHGVAPIPELRTKQGLDAGRVLGKDVATVGEKALAGLSGGPHIADVQYTDLYLSDSTRERAAKDPTILRPLLDAVARIPGVLRVLPATSVEGQRSSPDPIVRAAALSYAPGRSGDVLVVPKPYWIMTSSSAATHGTLHDYDQRVPVVLMGTPFKPGRYTDEASPADIMPTFASLIGLPLPGADGKPLAVATVHLTAP